MRPAGGRAQQRRERAPAEGADPAGAAGGGPRRRAGAALPRSIWCACSTRTRRSSCSRRSGRSCWSRAPTTPWRPSSAPIWCKSWGGRVMLADLLPGHSTTATVAASAGLSLLLDPQRRAEGGQAGGVLSAASRSAASMAKRCSSARRRAGASGCDGASRRISASIASATIRPASAGTRCKREVGVYSEIQRIAESPVSGHLPSVRKSRTPDFTSMQVKPPSGRSARMSARRPFGSGTSCSAAQAS